ncbi:uncharacterized protein RB166_008154 [Leptodactylus fuscus]|uniref:uncharacterized protein LOC142204568 n=1 Tax=Leptodactylus fuscus TaxID=238119 RepID=UPI003F4EC254
MVDPVMLELRSFDYLTTNLNLPATEWLHYSQKNSCHFQQNIQQGQITCHADRSPVSASQDRDIEYVGRKRVLHGDLSDLEIEIELTSLAFENLVLTSGDESSDSLSKDLNVEETVITCTDSQSLAEECSSHLSEPVKESSSMKQRENDISVCENTKCVQSKTIPMLELLILCAKKSQQKNYISKTLTPLWKVIADHRYAGPFRKPLQEKDAPGYKEIVKRPMDLSTIKKSLCKGKIRTNVEFQRDILLMLQNAVMYNSIHHSVHQKALELQRDLEELLQVFIEQVKQRETE